jgi:uncharacterized protein (TIGR02466 family)
MAGKKQKGAADPVEAPRDVLEPMAFFQTTVYMLKKPEYLASALSAANAGLAQAKKQIPQNETYPMTMTGSLSGLPETKDLENFIAESCWAVLDNQGYNLKNQFVYVSEFWCQEHRKFSGMEQHVHPHGVMLSGFYFLETPESGSLIELYDPRPGKVQASLPEKDNTIVSEATNQFFLKPEPGMLIITNSWLPHSFTRNSSDTPCKFIHFNASVAPQELLKTTGNNNTSGPVVV